MGKTMIELEDELFGFYVGAQGSTVVAHAPAIESKALVVVATKYATDYDDDADGWNWGLGATRLNREQVIALRDFLNERLGEE